jgi:hypothetical protein
MEAIAKMPAIVELNLDYTEVGDEGLAHISPDALIESLHLDATHVTDESVDVLTKLTRLRKLDLYHTLVTEEGKKRLDAALPDCEVVFDVDSSRPNRRRS